MILQEVPKTQWGIARQARVDAEVAPDPRASQTRSGAGTHHPSYCAGPDSQGSARSRTLKGGSMAKIVDGYFSLLRLLIVLCLAAMCVLVFANVVLRYAFNTGITVSEELSRWLFVWMTFLGAIVAMREHGHLGMDSLVARLAYDRQEDLPRRQPAADALRNMAAPQRELDADDDQPGRHGARIGALHRAGLRRRRPVRRFGDSDPVYGISIASCPASSATTSS